MKWLKLLRSQRKRLRQNRPQSKPLLPLKRQLPSRSLKLSRLSKLPRSLLRHRSSKHLLPQRFRPMPLAAHRTTRVKCVVVSVKLSAWRAKLHRPPLQPRL